MSNHEEASRLVVDLDAVARNYLYLSKKLQNGADCAAVVKADAYGLGAPAVAAALFRQGCRRFFVAYAEEALEVRKALPPATAPGQDVAIYVLNGPQGLNAETSALGIAPVLNTLGDIESWAGRGAAVLHIDTGMNRLGITARDVARLADQPQLLQGIDLRYVMSHLACADEPAHPKNAEQLALFKKLTASLNRPFRYSFANSGGIFLGPDYHFDLVRPGAAIYGINVTGQKENPMQGVVTLDCRILQIREIESAGSVGYGASRRISPPAKTATISVGYADGYFRSFDGRGAVYIQGEKCPVIGRVSMDCIVADIAALKKPVGAADRAEIIGPHQSLDDVAAQAGTIGYEILTGFGRRLKRTYKETA